MKTGVRSRGLVTAALVVVGTLTILTSHPAGRIVIDNDVIVDWQDQPRIVSASVVGGPHLVRDWSTARISVDFQKGTPVGTSDLQVAIYPPDLCSKHDPANPSDFACPWSGRMQIVFPLPEQGIPVTDFTTGTSGRLSQYPLPTPGILVVSGRIHGSSPGGDPEVLITISGDVSPVIVDRAGDVGLDRRSRAADVPARSIAIVQALNQIETGLLPKRPVELDTQVRRNTQSAVGYTHLFDFPLDARGAPFRRIQSAFATLRLTNTNGAFQDDFVLLDPGVRDLADQRAPFFVVPLRLLSQSSVPGSEDTVDFTIDLGSVPATALSGGRPSRGPVDWLDLTGELRDRQLNVIVFGDSAVDLSDLLVVFQDQ